MIRKILFASAATAAIAVAATPAAAQQACVTNPGAITAGTSTGSASIVCGTGSTDSGILHGTVFGVGSTVVAGSGNDSTIVGASSTAGQGAVAVGAHVTSTGGGTTAVGNSSNVTGGQSTALGAYSSSANINSVALGYGTATTADSQVAVGGRTISQVAAGSLAAGSTEAVNGGQIFTMTATQDTRDDAQDALIASSAAIDNYIAINSVGAANAVATGTDAIAIGRNSVAAGAGGIAMGLGATNGGAGATNSIAIGTGASNGGFANSVALGGFTNTAANQVRVGGTTAATARIVTGVAAGTISATSVDAVNGSQLNASNNRITALETMGTGFATDIANLNDRVDNVYRRGRAGTAVAIAMSGNGFLPDKKINVTGNVGFYSGAYAAAIQVGAILTDTVAFNAGVAKGLNDGGKMGARAGFTLGW